MAIIVKKKTIASLNIFSNLSFITVYTRLYRFLVKCVQAFYEEFVVEEVTTLPITVVPIDPEPSVNEAYVDEARTVTSLSSREFIRPKERCTINDANIFEIPSPSVLEYNYMTPSLKSRINSKSPEIYGSSSILDTSWLLDAPYNKISMKSVTSTPKRKYREL